MKILSYGGDFYYTGGRKAELENKGAQFPRKTKNYYSWPNLCHGWHDQRTIPEPPAAVSCFCFLLFIFGLAY